MPSCPVPYCGCILITLWPVIGWLLDVCCWSPVGPQWKPLRYDFFRGLWLQRRIESIILSAWVILSMHTESMVLREWYSQSRWYSQCVPQHALRVSILSAPHAEVHAESISMRWEYHTLSVILSACTESVTHAESMILLAYHISKMRRINGYREASYGWQNKVVSSVVCLRFNFIFYESNLNYKWCFNACEISKIRISERYFLPFGITERYFLPKNCPHHFYTYNT